MDDSHSLNPYQSPTAVDAPTDETFDAARPGKPLKHVVARFRAERQAMAATIFFFGVGAGLIAFYAMAESGPLLPVVLRLVAIVSVTVMPAACYMFPTPVRLRVGTCIFALLCFGILMMVIRAVVTLPMRFEAVIGLIPLVVLVPCLLQSMRIERYAARMRREGLSLRATSLQVIYSDAVSNGGKASSDHSSG